MKKNLSLPEVSLHKHRNCSLRELFWLVGIFILSMMMPIEKVKAQACKPIIQMTGVIDPCYSTNTVILTAVGSILSCQWSTGAATQSTAIPSAGTYTVTATYIGGCTGTASITVSNSFTNAIQLTGDGNDCRGAHIQYTISNPQPGVSNYYWTPQNFCSVNTPTGTTNVVTTSGVLNAPASFTISYTTPSGCNRTETFYIQPCCVDPIGTTWFDTDINSMLGISPSLFNNNLSPIYLNGVITVNTTIAIDNCPNIRMGPGAQIIIQSPCTLTTTHGTHLKAGCNVMWKGIHVLSGAGIRYADLSVIEDAEVGIDAEANTSYFEIGSNANPVNFINNYIDVRINGNIPSTYGVENANFNYTGSFVAPYGGQKLVPTDKPYAAFVINNLITFPTIVFGGAGGSGNISITNHACGFECHNSNLIIRNTTFTNITLGANYGSFPLSQNGFAVYADAFNDRSLTLTGLGIDPIASPLTFSNCSGGVSTKSMNVKITECRMNVTRYGIYSRLAQSPSNLIYANNIINVGPTNNTLFGINMHYTGTAPVSISNNKIYVNKTGIGFKQSACIFHNDARAANNTKVNITWNEARLLNKTDYGIRMESINNSNLSNNFVYCNQATLAAPVHHCFSSWNCIAVQFIENYANYLSTEFQPNGIGYYNYISSGWLYQCNRAYQINTGFQFEKSCISNEMFKGNYMQENSFGLFITGALGAIGSQTHQGNIWMDNPAPFIPFTQAASVNGGANPAASQFTVHLPTIAINNYNPVTSTSMPFIVAGGTPFACSIIQERPPQDTIEIIEGEVSDADSINDGDEGNMGEWVYNRNLYRTIDDNVGAYDSSYIIQNYHDSLSATAIGQLNEVEKTSSMPSPELTAIAAQFSYNDSVSVAGSIQMSDNNKLINSGTLNQSDSLALAITNNNMLTLLIQIGLAQDSLANAARWYHQKIANNANSKNDLVMPVRNFESNQKAIHTIYMRTVAVGNDNFTTDEVNTIFTIAQQCISYGGPAVIEARSLYALINPNYNFENSPCTIAGNRWALNDDAPAEINTVLVYPNPASDEINVKLPANTGTDVTVAIYHATGNRVKSFKGMSRNSFVIQVSDLTNGLYFLKTTSFDSAVNTVTKFQIIK